MTKRRSRITNVHPCDHTAQVVTVVSPVGKAYRQETCAECPWRKDSPIGAFPVEAYRHSAATAYDLASSTFACHMAGAGKPQTCAGFLMSSGAEHNMALRMAASAGRFRFGQSRSDAPVYESYREMAVANGVEPDDPCLQKCR